MSVTKAFLVRSLSLASLLEINCYAAALVPDALWSLIRPILPASTPSRKVVGHVYPTELASQVFCSDTEVDEKS